MSGQEGFVAFVEARSPALVSAAWLLTGDLGMAQDLVQSALAKTWTRWDRVVRKDAPEAYVRRVMVSTFLTWRRRRWHAELPAANVPEQRLAGDEFNDVDLRMVVAHALRRLPPHQRAVVVLRYFHDLTESQAAEALGCSRGTIKSQSFKALQRLRGCPELMALLQEEVSRDGS